MICRYSILKSIPHFQSRLITFFGTSIASDRTREFSNKSRNQVNRRRQGVLSATVLFWVGCITTIAAATILKADALLSWNFKHMVNFFRIRQYNGINLKHGYSELDIRSPREVLS